MNLQPVTGPFFTTTCNGCNRRVNHWAHNEPTLWADLDGEPFKAYYCEPCATQRRRSAEKDSYGHA